MESATDLEVGTGMAAQILGRSTQTVRNWVDDGKLTPHRTTATGHLKFLLSEVLACKTRVDTAEVES